MHARVQSAASQRSVRAQRAHRARRDAPSAARLVEFKVFHPPQFGYVHTGNVAYDEFGGPIHGLRQYRPDSRLLIVVGANKGDSAQRGIAYFVWEGEALRRIRFVHRAYE